jgi:hypothetical protein
MDTATATIWGFSEFGKALLGDARRCKRAARIAAGLLCNVGSAISSSCGGGGAQAVTRFFDCDDVTEESILSGHQMQIGERCKQQEGRILVAQDTTTLDFPDRTNISGLGPTSPNGGNGMFMHSGIVMNEQKLPVGVLGLRFWCRDAAQRGIKKLRKKRNTMEKESAKWIWGLEQVNKQLSGLGKEIVLIGDRESDMYDLFAYNRPSDVHLLVRMTQNRIVKVNDIPTKMYSALDNSPLLGTYNFVVPKEDRIAKLEVRSCFVELCPPKGRKPITTNTVRVWAVEIREVDAPKGVKPLIWRLLTTLDGGSFDSCRYIADCYSTRWSIEEFHRTLKTGCEAERLQFETLSRLRPAIAMLSVVALQVMYLTRYARCYPEAPASRISTPEERETVETWVQVNRFSNYDIITVADYVRGIGFIGGFRGRKHDGEPGVKAIWEGIRNLTNLVAGRRIERRRAAQT